MARFELKRDGRAVRILRDGVPFTGDSHAETMFRIETVIEMLNAAERLRATEQAERPVEESIDWPTLVTGKDGWLFFHTTPTSPYRLRADHLSAAWVDDEAVWVLAVGQQEPSASFGYAHVDPEGEHHDELAQRFHADLDQALRDAAQRPTDSMLRAAMACEARL